MEDAIACISTSAAVNEKNDHVIHDKNEQEVDPLQKANTGREEEAALPGQQQQQPQPQQPSQLKSQRCSIRYCWERLANLFRRLILLFVQSLSGCATRHPKTVIAIVPLLSLLLLGIGYVTNFSFTMDPEFFLVPTNTKITRYYDSLIGDNPKAFLDDRKTTVSIMIHADGQNVLTRNSARSAIQVVNEIMTIPEYDSVCTYFQQQQQEQQQANDIDIDINDIDNVNMIPYYQPQCFVYSITRYWNHNLTLFDTTVQTDEDVMDTISTPTFELDGTNTPVAHEAILGNYQYDNNTVTTGNRIEYAESLIINWNFPNAPDVDYMEQSIITILKRIRKEWSTASDDDEDHHPNIVLEFVTPASLEEEVTRAVIADVWLIPLVIIIMTNFTACVWCYTNKSNPIQRRFMLGYGAVITVAFSLITGFGVMFCFGVPATSILPILPYIVFGIAMDDTFIITGAYFRTAEMNLDLEGKTDTSKNDQNIIGTPTSSSTNAIDGQDTYNSHNVAVVDNDADERDDIIIRRMEYTMNDIGVSITLTTLTTVVAFLLSTFSTVPAIQWLGWYACCTIFVDFIYQITFFVALLVLDERRIHAKRHDVCFWIVDKNGNGGDDGDDVDGNEKQQDEHLDNHRNEEDTDNVAPLEMTDDRMGNTITVENHCHHSDHQAVASEDRSGYSDQVPQKSVSPLQHETAQEESALQDSTIYPSEPHTLEREDKVIAAFDNTELAVYNPPDMSPPTPPSPAGRRRLNFSERAMQWYSRNLILNRYFQFLVIVLFLGYFAACCYSATLLRQEWKIQDFVPDNSYITDFINSMNSYMSFTTLSAVYFRHVNQSDPNVQDQMRSYYDEMSTMEHTSGDRPFPFCWVKDIPNYQRLLGLDKTNMTYVEQLDALFAITAFDEVYSNDIVRNPNTGEIVVSRCWFFLTNVDFDDVHDQLDYYHQQDEITSSQPINEGRDDEDWPFVSFEYIYFVWQYYDAIASELTFSTISGVVALSFIGFILMPHWSAIFYLLPLIIILYMDVMGTIQFMGLHIDSMTFGCIIVSVGLLVDFLMHILLRYYEVSATTRQEKTQKTIITMGSSVALGGLSTFLGILPLALGQSMVMRTVFLCFSTMIVLGLGHGLIFLPVLLSLTGPVNKPVGDGGDGGDSGDGGSKPELVEKMETHGADEDKTSRLPSS